jgi:hypothetical protein
LIRILLIAALILAIISLPAYFRLSKERRQRVRKLILIGIIVLLVSRALPGLFGVIIPLLMALVAGLIRFLPVLIRYAPLLHRLWFSWKQQHNPSSNHGAIHPTIDTHFLRIQLDQLGQPISGEVLIGKFSGRQILSLDTAELALLFKECVSDKQSMDLLQRLIRHNANSQSSRQQSSSNPSRNRSNRLTAEQSYKLLGLKTHASRKEIITAHRRLIQKNHPDRGGSAELAAQINEARDVLLNQ